ncbi:hypothetical protein OBBRIDRAFT_794426 [Obba rivulosa]|uniref:Uncharacterized protein n=1 Tax=Obba rivulosa TaxID=1052685 RepID=A0A8E2DKY0_9APHY|nr:hypothetical protein OBBRIDRAFT_794426 [Obba rivulosa]
MALPLVQARIFTLLFSAIFLGAHLITLLICLWTLLVRHPAAGLNVRWSFVAITLIMGAIGILNVSVDAFTNVEVWTTGDISLFTKESAWMQLVKNVDISIQLFIGDAVLSYRCWVVYDRRWFFIVPSMILLAGYTVAAVFLVTASARADTSSGINSTQLQRITSSQIALTVAVNTVTASLIVFRIWRVNRTVRMYTRGQSKLQYTMRVIVESGLMYTATAIITLGTAVSRSAAVYITSDCLVQITAITFNLIIIRFDYNLASRSQVHTELNTRAIALNSLASSRPAFHGTREIARVEIEVTQDTEVDSGSSKEEVKGHSLTV